MLCQPISKFPPISSADNPTAKFLSFASRLTLWLSAAYLTSKNYFSWVAFMRVNFFLESNILWNKTEAWLNGDGAGTCDFPLAVLRLKKMVCHSRKSSTHNKSTILMDPSSNPYINISWSMSLYHSLEINLCASSSALIFSTNSSAVISGSKLGNLVGSTLHVKWTNHHDISYLHIQYSGG